MARRGKLAGPWAQAYREHTKNIGRTTDYYAGMMYALKSHIQSEDFSSRLDTRHTVKIARLVASFVNAQPENHLAVGRNGSPVDIVLVETARRDGQIYAAQMIRSFVDTVTPDQLANPAVRLPLMNACAKTNEREDLAAYIAAKLDL